MISQDQLTKAQQDFQINSAPLHENIAAIKDKIAKLGQPYLDMLELYYDQQLIDKNGVPVKVDYYITDGKQNYLVVNRGMQFVFGDMMFNPRVMCKKVGKDDCLLPNYREKHIHPTELKKYCCVKNEVL